MENKVLAYKNVFNRQYAKEFSFEQFVNEPIDIFKHFGTDESKAKELKDISDKSVRNEEKRQVLPCVDLSLSGILSIDIDNISHRPEIIKQCVDRLHKLKDCMCVKESASGNLVAFFKYDCQVSEYKFLYYKLYLELVLLLSVSIDFLPEIGRLRYVNEGKVFFYREESGVITEFLEVDEVPYINSQVNKGNARRVIFGSN